MDGLWNRVEHWATYPTCPSHVSKTPKFPIIHSIVKFKFKSLARTALTVTH